MKRLPRPMIAVTAVLIAGIGSAGSGRAATWQVAKDGTPDFTVIQDAVDASASGDTIVIGPGRYEDFRWVDLGNTLEYVRIRDKSLTLVGAGAGQTIIGHESPPFPSYTATWGIVSAGSDIDFRMRGVTVDHIQAAASVHVESGRVEIEDCAFSRSFRGCFVEAPRGGWLRNCEFDSVGLNQAYTEYAVTVYEPTTGFAVYGCTFTDCGAGVGAYWDYVTDLTIANCAFVRGRTGVAFADQASGVVRECNFLGQKWYGVVCSGAGTVYLERNEIRIDDALGIGYGVCMFQPPGTIRMRQNRIVAGQGNACIGFTMPGASMDAQDNEFLLDDEVSYFAKGYPRPGATGGPYPVDVSGNWWGTTDTAAIASKILDANDDPELRCEFVFEPILDGPVPTEKKSLGGLKALFLGR